jgi:hypoxanthine phosphoribosyltransferase
MTTRLRDDFVSGKLGRRLVCQEEIQSRIRGLAKEINAFYEWTKEDIIVIGLMDGATMFLSDLIKLIPFKIKLYLIKIKTYDGINKITNSKINTGDFSDDFCNSIQDNNILIVDDILDTGEALHSICEAVQMFGPKTLKTVVLLNKNRKKEYEITPDFVGFNIEDKFVVGYGLDFNGYYRNLIDICVFNP